MSEIHKQLGLPSIALGKTHVDLHPDNLTAFADDLLEVIGGEVMSTPSSDAYAKAYEALAAVYEWHADVGKAEEAFLKSGKTKADMTGQRLNQLQLGMKQKLVHGGEKDVYTAAVESMSLVSKHVDRQMKAVEKFREDVVKRIDTAMTAPELKTPFGIAAAQSIWQHMTSMKDGTDQLGERITAASLRGSLIMNAIKQEDKLTVMSILNAPHYLSGLKPEQVQVYRDQAALSWAPKESRHLGAIDKILEKVQKSAGSMMVRTSELSKTVGKASTYEKQASVALQQLRNRPVGWGQNSGPLANPNGGK